MTNVGTHESGAPILDQRNGDQLVPRVSTLIAKGALLQERRLQVSENGEVRWIGPERTPKTPSPAA